MITKDWVGEAVKKILDGTPFGVVDELNADAMAAAIRSACPFSPGVVYTPVGAIASDFQRVGEFHTKFGLPVSADGPPRELTHQELKFRLRFLLEEISELADAYGLTLEYGLGEEFEEDRHPIPQDLPQAFDALIDLVYVALGTAHMHRFPWDAGFNEVQRANMAKERAAADGSNSRRGSALDVVKPTGWTAPNISKVLMRAGWPGPALPFEKEPA